jgi:uncharacterized protein (TIGR03067 family)
MRLLMFCVAVVVLVPCAALCDDKKKDEEAKVDGTWLATEAEMSGKTLPKTFSENLKLTLKDKDYEVVADSPDRGTVTYNNSADPKEMDIKGVEGPNKGKTYLAIYKLKDDKLTICYDLSGESRPTEFKTKAKTKLFLVTYERKKAGAKEAK